MYELYFKVRSIEEALQKLAGLEGKGRVIAGGTDLVIDLKEGKVNTKGLVDVTFIPKLTELKQQGGEIVVGAAVTHHRLANAPLILEKATVLAEAAHAVGSPQIRRMGTVGGNVANAQPAADTAVALVALDARALVRSKEGARQAFVADLYRGPGSSFIDNRQEVLVSFQFKAHGKGEGSAFARLSQRKALSLPMLNVAVYAALEEERIRDIRIVAAPVDIRPLRALAAEEELKGTPAAEADIARAAEAAAAAANPRDSLLRGSSEYRKAMVKVLVRRAVAKAVARARSNEG